MTRRNYQKEISDTLRRIEIFLNQENINDRIVDLYKQLELIKGEKEGEFKRSRALEKHLEIEFVPIRNHYEKKR